LARKTQWGGKYVTGLFTAVLTIGAADATMSLDNVLALAALAHGNVLLMVLGVVMSIPLVIVGAAIISKVIEHFPILTWAGAGLLGWVAGGIIASDPWVAPFTSYYIAAAAGAVIVLAVGGFHRFKYEPVTQ
jgi:predicted tellurium resistance membrane protein TerC